jgi:adenosylcobinamide-phosphate synthase
MAAMAIALALALEAALGWPGALHRRIGHPVVWIGALIAALERRLNRGGPRRRLAAGALATAATVGATTGAAALIEAALPGGWPGVALTAVVAWPLLAARSLHDHVAPVRDALAAGDLVGARAAVSLIVGRDPARLDGAGCARAALESLAENASDGVIAPLVWGALLGLPGIAGYKAINTLDSMIGHRSDRYAHFGRVAARLDDLANLAPARLTGALIALAGGRPGASLRCMARDARAHRSPNAGWPETALAGALGVRLSGPRAYADGVSREPWLNAAAPDPDAAAMTRGLAVYRRAMALGGALLLAGALAAA